METKSMKLRQFCSDIFECFEYFMPLNPNHYNTFVQTMATNEIVSHNEEDSNSKIMNIIIPSIKVVSFCDYYKELVYKSKIFFLDVEDKEVLDTFEIMDSYVAIDYLFTKFDSISFGMIKSLLDFYNLDGLEKVLRHKSLSDKDISILKNVNPLFEEDHKHYDVKIDDELIMRHINKLSANFDEDRAYKQVVNFILKLYIVNKDELKDYLIKLFDGSDLPVITENGEINLDNISDDDLENVIRNKYKNDIKKKEYKI